LAAFEETLSRLLPQSDVKIIMTAAEKGFSKSSKILKPEQVPKKLEHIKDPSVLKIHNHIENNFHMGNKKALYYNMRAYYESKKMNVFDFLPVTFHIKGSSEESIQKFVDYYQKR
jgi:hypothetical protein